MSVFQPGNSAVITGGANGIGLALAAKCVAAGLRVLVVDWDAAGLAAVPTHAAGPGTVATVRADVGRLEDWAAVRAAVDAHLGGQVHLLALNAGVGGASPWADPAAFRRIWDVNVLGVVHGLATLLPLLVEEGEGKRSVVFTGSKQGITNPPGTSPAYNASKAAVRSLAEQLSFDLAARAPAVSVHLLVPGWTFTALTTTSGTTADVEKPAGAWWPAQVVDYLVAAMQDPQRFYVLCPDNDVTEAQDRRRVLWSAGDIAEGRPPLSRWRPAYKEQVDAWMSKE